MKIDLKLAAVVSILILIACTQKSTLIKLCETTISDYAKYRDNPETADLYANLFTPDGSFTLGSNTVTGRDALSARHAGSHESATWQHKMGSTELSNDNEAITGVSRVTVKTSPKDNPKTIRTIVADYQDTFAIVDAACLIKARGVKIVLDDTVTVD